MAVQTGLDTVRTQRFILLTMLGTPNRDRVAERRAARRREILDAAWAIAREVGLTQITLRDVAERVGMQAPSLYTPLRLQDRDLRRDVRRRPGRDYEATLAELDGTVAA